MKVGSGVEAGQCADALTRDGFCFVAAGRMRKLLEWEPLPPDWPRFAASWHDLGPDPYLATVGRQRRRRHAVFSAAAHGPIHREPHQPHYQSVAYNPLQGDIERWFEPVTPEIGATPALHRILGFARDFFGGLAPSIDRWHIEMHQFRIEASAETAGEPTPEGVHRDGVDYVLVVLIDRKNIASGTTTICTADGQELGKFTLTQPLDAAFVDDHRLYHGVTPVTPLDPIMRGHRDVLVLTLRAGAGAGAGAGNSTV